MQPRRDPSLRMTALVRRAVGCEFEVATITAMSIWLAEELLDLLLDL
jgi:hypothetical protein